MCPDTGKPVYLKNGRFGPYVQRAGPTIRKRSRRTHRFSKA